MYKTPEESPSGTAQNKSGAPSPQEAASAKRCLENAVPTYERHTETALIYRPGTGTAQEIYTLR